MPCFRRSTAGRSGESLSPGRGQCCGPCDEFKRNTARRAPPRFTRRSHGDLSLVVGTCGISYGIGWERFGGLQANNADFRLQKLAVIPSLSQANRVSRAEADTGTAWASQKSQRELANAISRFQWVCWKIGWEKLLLRMGLEQVPK